MEWIFQTRFYYYLLLFILRAAPRHAESLLDKNNKNCRKNIVNGGENLYATFPESCLWDFCNLSPFVL